MCRRRAGHAFGVVRRVVVKDFFTCVVSLSRNFSSLGNVRAWCRLRLFHLRGVVVKDFFTWQQLTPKVAVLLPSGATVSRFANNNTGVLLEGEVVERQRARAICKRLRLCCSIDQTRSDIAHDRFGDSKPRTRSGCVGSERVFFLSIVKFFVCIRHAPQRCLNKTRATCSL